MRRRRVQMAAVGALLVLLALLGPSGAASDGAPQHGPGHLTAGYSAQVFIDVDTEGARSITRMWSDQILRRRVRVGTPESLIFDDVGTLERAFREKRVDVAVLRPDEYLSLRSRVPLQPVFVTVQDRGPYDQIVLLVRRDRGLRRLDDLRNLGLTVSTERAGSPHLQWLEILMMREGFRGPEEFFSAVKRVAKPSQAILPVFSKQSDACLTSMRAFEVVCELNPQVGRELACLVESPAAVAGLIVFRKDVDEAVKGRLTEALATLHLDPEGRQLLRLFRLNRLEAFEPRHLEAVEALVKEYEMLKRKLARRP